MTYDIILTIGKNVNGIPTLQDTDIINTLQRIGILGATLIPCVGIWEGEREESTRIEICGVQEPEVQRIKAAIPSVCRELRQNCIMWDCRHSSTVEFIG